MMNMKEKIRNNIFMLLTHLQTARELEKTIIEELNKLSKEYELCSLRLA